MKTNSDGISKLKDLIKSVDKVRDIVHQYDGQEIDLNVTSVFVPDGMGSDRLVQDSMNSSAEEKIEFILKNPEADRFLQGLRNDIERAFK